MVCSFTLSLTSKVMHFNRTRQKFLWARIHTWKRFVRKKNPFIFAHSIVRTLKGVMGNSVVNSCPSTAWDHVTCQYALGETVGTCPCWFIISQYYIYSSEIKGFPVNIIFRENIHNKIIYVFIKLMPFKKERSVALLSLVVT